MGRRVVPTTTTLIVENDPAARQRFEVYLDGRGMAHDFATDPRGAIAKLSEGRFDYVFLDLDLGAGIQDGKGVLAWMERHGKHIPTLLISEAANLPSVIRLEKKAYPHFVWFRMQHGDFDHIADLVDEAMTAREKQPTTLQPLGSRPRPPGALALLLVLMVVLATLFLIANKLSAAMFTALITASIIIFILMTMIWLVSAGLVSETGLIKVITDVLKKVPMLGAKR